MRITKVAVVGAGDRVLTMLDPSLEYLAAWFGVMWAGAVDVPVNTDFKGAFLERVGRPAAGEHRPRRFELLRLAAEDHLEEAVQPLARQQRAGEGGGFVGQAGQPQPQAWDYRQVFLFVHEHDREQDQPVDVADAHRQHRHRDREGEVDPGPQLDDRDVPLADHQQHARHHEL